MLAQSHAQLCMSSGGELSGGLICHDGVSGECIIIVPRLQTMQFSICCFISIICQVALP